MHDPNIQVADAEVVTETSRKCTDITEIGIVWQNGYQNGSLKDSDKRCDL